MNTFYCLDTMWLDALKAAYSGAPVDPRSFPTTECLGWSGKLMANLQMTWLSNERRALDPAYAAAEVLWYLSRSADVTMIKAYAPQYERFAEDDGKAHGAYGRRLVYDDQDALTSFDLLDIVTKLLCGKPTTRQCVIPLHRPRDLLHSAEEYYASKKDIPCTICWHFLVRESILHMVVYMRSNDVWLGMPYDVFANTCIQRLLAGQLGVSVGSYTHNVGSMHLYDKHRQAAYEAVRANYEPHAHAWKMRDTFFDVSDSLRKELFARDPSRCVNGASDTLDSPPIGSMMRDLLICCQSKWFVTPPEANSNALNLAIVLTKKERIAK